ncbi:hypothetical protein V6N12_032158 [Hibiscus sabdariffa]|uniref:Uncharacterized protein n=1 Tax=Hibiscus sabdariffa TaxID=183260 RepID=A0ABR2CC91_9ROSI
MGKPRGAADSNYRPLESFSGMFRSSSPLLRKSEPPVQVQDTIITAWTIRHPTRNRNDPIARAELYQLSYIPRAKDLAREVNHRTYGPTNWERINRFLFGSDSSFPNAAYNSPLYCALQVCLFPPPSLPWQLSPDLREKHEKKGSNGTIPPSPQNERGDLVVLGARSTTELIARRAGLPLGARYAKSERNPIPLFPFYAPMSPHGRRSSLLFGCEAVSNQNTQQALALPEKEVIQPHLPVRLPCYDFTPVTSPAFGIPLLAVKVTTSGMANSRSVTGGVYKARERIHRHALRPIIPDNACILCITAAAGTELADAYSPDSVIASSLGKEVHDPWAFYLHAALLRQAFAHCGKFPTAASRRSLGRVSVPVWLIILSDQLLIIALVSYCLTN